MKRLAILLILVLIGASQAYSLEGKLALRDSIDTAKKNSQSIAIAKARLEAAEALSGQAFAAFLPQLRLDASLGRSYAEQPLFVIGSQELSFDTYERDTFSYSGNLTQNIFTGGKIWNSWQIASLGVDIAREELRSTEIDLTYNVVSAYYGVIKAIRALGLSLESLELAKHHLTQTKVMFDSGIVTKAETLRAELEVARAELSLSRAKSGVALANNTFNLITGRDLDASVSLDEEDFRIGELTAPDYEEFLAVAYTSRPDWKIVSLSREITDKEKWISYTGYMPLIYLSGSYGYNNVKYPALESDSNLENWNVMLVSSWTLFDGLATPNKVKEAYSKYTEAEKNKELLVKNIAIEVKDACLALNSAVDEVKASRKALELAGENYKIAELRYSSGVGTNIEVIDAKTLLASAKLEYLEAEFKYELAKAAVNKAVGREVLGEGREVKKDKT